MTLSEWQQFLLHCTLIHYSILILWFVAFRVWHDGLYGFHARWFSLTPAQFDALNYGGLGLYKLAIFLFCLVPWLALTFWH